MRTAALGVGLLTTTFLFGFAFAGAVNPVANGDFELFVPFGAALMQDTPADGMSLGVGRQVLGCTHTANAIWQSDCSGAPRNPVFEVRHIALDPFSEVEAWTEPGAQRGDLVIVAPQDQGFWHAVDWSQYPSGSVAFGDHDGDGDREALALAGNRMLYQSFASASPHTAIPAGSVGAVTAAFEAGAPAGTFTFVLDSFPLESVRDWPQAFLNYQLHIPATTWGFADGVVTIDPLRGSLSGPAPGAYIVGDRECVDAAGVCAEVPPGTDDHPTAAQWNAASREERRAMLMEFRIVQMTFWDLQAGTQVDDVAFDLGV